MVWSVVYNKKTAQSHTGMHSNFTLKTASFWLNTKSKVQNFIHFSISHSQNQKFNIIIIIILYVFVILLVYYLIIFFFFLLVYICVTFFVIQVIFFFKTYRHTHCHDY